MWWMIVVGGIVALLFLTTYICFHITFRADRRLENEEFPIPDGEIYVPYREQMVQWMKDLRALPCEELTVTSTDGLTLYGRYYEYAPDAPIEIMFHGYRGSAERDLCGGVQRAFALGHSVMLVDQRTSGKSGGHVITFGIRERYDCVKWVERLSERFPDRPILLTGISMGAATVTMAAPMVSERVVGVLADCGYTSPRAIICKVIRDLHLPPVLLYPFVKLGARLFGGFDLEEASSVEALKTCRVPVIFFHGDNDAFVPCEMSRENFEACAADKKRLIITPNAGHGLCYLLDPDGYLKEVREFFD